MQRTFMPAMLGGALVATLLSAPIQAQTATGARNEPGLTAPDAVSVRGCRLPAEAKEAQVLTFESWNLQAKLAVSVGKDEFKVVTVRLWEHPNDPRPLVPVIEAARITQGKLHFYTPNLNADPQPIHEKDYVVMATLGGAQICWANPGSLVKEGGRPSSREAKPEAAAEETTPAPRTRRRGRAL